MADYFNGFTPNSTGANINISPLLSANGGNLDIITEQSFIRAFIADLIIRSNAGNFPSDATKTIRVASSVTSIDYQMSMTVIGGQSYIVRTIPVQIIDPFTGTFDPG